jgi:ABC-type polysaccharide/polyol phosphate export permease
LPMATIIVLFGFIVFGSFNSADMKGYIPYLIVGSMACMGLSVLLVKMLK